MNENMFSGFTQAQKHLIFEGLMLHLKSQSNLGFLNDRLGMAYVLGAKDGQENDAHGDSPERNDLYKMLVELSEDLRGHPEISKFVNCWQDFCRIAVESHRRRR